MKRKVGLLGIKCDENGGGAAEEVGHKSEGINSTDVRAPSDVDKPNE